METNADESNNLQTERREEVQDLIFFLKNTLGFLVLCFNCLSSKPLKNLLAIVQEIPNEFYAKFNAFVLIILGKGKAPEIYGSNNETIPTREILSFFSDENCSQLTYKPKLFIFQTILTSTKIPAFSDRRIPTPSNSVVLSVYPRNESQIPVFIDHIKDLYYNTPIDEVVEEFKEQFRDQNCHVECRKNFDCDCNRILATTPTHSK